MIMPANALPAKHPPTTYGPPRATAGTLAIWWTFKLYCLAMVLFLGAQLALGITMMASPATLLKNDSSYRQDPEKVAGLTSFVGLIVAAVSAPQLLVIVPAFFCPHCRVGWWLGMFALIAGVFTTGGWLLAVPLVFFWGNRNLRAWCGLGVPARQRA